MTKDDLHIMIITGCFGDGWLEAARSGALYLYSDPWVPPQQHGFLFKHGLLGMDITL